MWWLISLLRVFFLILVFTFKPDFLEVTLGQHRISQRLCLKHLYPVRHPSFADGSVGGLGNTFKQLTSRFNLLCSMFTIPHIQQGRSKLAGVLSGLSLGAHSLEHEHSIPDHQA